MRRDDRALSREQALKVLSRCGVCRIALSGEGAPYILPLCFGLCQEEGAAVLYFHSAGQGRKLALLAKNPRVGFEADTAGRIIEGTRACDFTMEYESVIGEGCIEVVTDREHKRRALSILMARYSDRKDFSFSDAALDGVTVLRLAVDAMTGKRLARA